MSGAVLEARAIITGEDRTKAAFESVKARISAITRQVEAVDKAFASVGIATKAVDAIQVSSGRANADMAKLVSTTHAVGEASVLAQRSALQFSEAVKGESVAIREAGEAIGAMTSPLGRLISEQERLAIATREATVALDREAAAEIRAATAARKAADIDAAVAQQQQRAAHQRQEHIRRHGVINYLAMGAAGYVGAHGVVSGIEEAFKAGADYQHEIVGLQNAGRTPEQIAAIQKRSSEVVGKLPTATYLDNLKVITETTGAFGSVEHALDHLEFMQKIMSVLKASGGEHVTGTSGDVGRALAKVFEERFTKPENFEKEAGAMIPAMVFSGGTFNPETLLAFAQQAKGSLPNYSMRFLSRVAPSLIGAMKGGDRAGTAANAFTSIIMGKVNDKKQAEEWERYGLLDKGQVISKAGHVVSWRAGAVKNTPLALSDPLAWAEQVALPAMAAKGVKIDDRMALAIALGTMFRNQNGNLFANEIMQPDSRNRLHKDEALINGVGTTDDIFNRNVTADPKVGMEALKAALENLMTTLSGEKLGLVASGLTTVAHGIDVLANALKDHPLLGLATGATTAAAGLGTAGWLSAKFMSGFGLNEPAAHLDRAASALEAAASRIGGGQASAATNGAGAVAGDAAAGGGVLSRAAAAAPEAAAATGLLAMIAAGAYLIGASNNAQQPGQGGAWSAPTPVTANEDQARLEDMKQQLAAIDAEIKNDTERSRNPDALDMLLRPLLDNKADLTNEINALTAGLHDQKVELDPGSKAEISATFEVKPSSELLQVVEKARSLVASGSLAAGGTSGGVGTAYPETAPSGRGIGSM